MAEILLILTNFSVLPIGITVDNCVELAVIFELVASAKFSLVATWISYSFGSAPNSGSCHNKLRLLPTREFLILRIVSGAASFNLIVELPASVALVAIVAATLFSFVPLIGT